MIELSAEFPEKLKFLFKPSRYKVAYGGRGSAKSWSFARALLIKAAEKPIRWLCAREVQNSIKQSVHLLLCDQIQQLGLGSYYEPLQNEIRGRNGSLFSFTGLSNQTAESIKSYEGYDGVWVEEGQTVSKRSWDILIPTIRKDDSEIWISFNPNMDTDDTYVRFVVNAPPNAQVVKVNYSDNPWFPPVLEQERLHAQKTMLPEDYRNIWEGECRTVVEGAIYKNEILSLIEEKRIRQVPYDPLLKVHTIWDLGWNDQMSIILAQRLGSEIRLIEYIEDSHKILTDYISDLKNRKYQWGKDWLPHDGEAKDYKTGKSAQEILQSLGRNVEIVPKMDVEAGIKAARLLFPRCYFDVDKTKRLVDCLKRYRRLINSVTNEPGSPLHDEHSHGADAFRYLAVIADKMKNDETFRKPIKYPNTGIV